MKRNMDLVRQILFEIEKCENPWGPNEIEIEGHSGQVVSYHIKLLSQAGLMEAEDASCMGPEGFSWSAGPLTWEGHEFLDAARDQTIWKKAKSTVLERVGEVPFEVLKELLIQSVKSSVFGP